MSCSLDWKIKPYCAVFMPVNWVTEQHCICVRNHSPMAYFESFTKWQSSSGKNTEKLLCQLLECMCQRSLISGNSFKIMVTKGNKAPGSYEMAGNENWRATSVLHALKDVIPSFNASCLMELLYWKAIRTNIEVTASSSQTRCQLFSNCLLGCYMNKVWMCIYAALIDWFIGFLYLLHQFANFTQMITLLVCFCSMAENIVHSYRDHSCMFSMWRHHLHSSF